LTQKIKLDDREIIRYYNRFVLFSYILSEIICAEFGLSEKQAEALLDITLRKLTSLEVSASEFYCICSYLVKVGSYFSYLKELNGPLLFAAEKIC
jgi:hypothetical protein